MGRGLQQFKSLLLTGRNCRNLVICAVVRLQRWLFNQGPFPPSRLMTIAPGLVFSNIVCYCGNGGLEKLRLRQTQNLPLTPVLSGSTWASFTLPSSITSAYLLLLFPPKMADPSKVRSSASENFAVGSPRKRIWNRSLELGAWTRLYLKWWEGEPSKCFQLRMRKMKYCFQK